MSQGNEFRRGKKKKSRGEEPASGYSQHGLSVCTCMYILCDSWKYTELTTDHETSVNIAAEVFWFPKCVLTQRI